MNKQIVIVRYPSHKKEEAETIKSELEAEKNIKAVLVSEQVSVEVLPTYE